MISKLTTENYQLDEFLNAHAQYTNVNWLIYMKLTKGRKKRLYIIWQRTRARHPELSEAEVDILATKEFKKELRSKLNKRQEKKRANARRRNAKGKKSISTGGSLWTVSGGGVSPR